MRLKLLAALVVVLAALAWVAGPALSLRPYMPGAVDFESSLPTAKHVAKDRWISPPVEAEGEFDLVGVAGELREVEIRVRSGDGDWSEWVPQEDATPIYVAGADEAQVRAPFRPSGELHFVNVSGTAGGWTSDLLTSARSAINTAFISVASTPVVQAATRTPPAPAIVPRASWGADTPGTGCPPRGPAEYGSVQAAVIHHTVNANDYPPEQAPAIVLGICRFHVNANGWNDIGYNALVDRYGVLYEGRAGGLSYPVVGAHAQGFNSQTTSIASIGDHTSEAPTPEAVRSIIQYLAWRLVAANAYPATGTTAMTSAGGSLSRYPSGTAVTLPRIIGHLDVGQTECPASLEQQLPTIRNAVQKRIKKYLAPKKKKKKKPKRKKPKRGKRGKTPEKGRPKR